ncbi:MAG: hypothetical protein Fur005_18150 [Roseiflexaceae bacterium]
MPPQPKPNHAASANLLISAAAIAGTLAGWAALSTQVPSAEVLPEAASAAAAPAVALPTWLQSPPNIPTLATVATLVPQQDQQLVAADPAQPAAAAPVVANPPPLRQVTAPPAPAQPARPVVIARTRSSR